MRRTCQCPCPQHPGPPKTVVMVGVPPIDVKRESDGYVTGQLFEDGTARAYFFAYIRDASGARLVEQPMPDTVPESWLPAVARVEKFLADAQVPA